MVYYRSPNYRIDGRISLNDQDFWKLDPNLDPRSQCGLLNYTSTCTLSELQAFCKARRIKVPVKARRYKTRLAKLLKDTDEQCTFAGFLALPPELRVRIYALHKAWLGFGDHVVPPPLAGTCKVLRREVVGEFFRERMFLVHRAVPAYFRTSPYMPLADLELQVVTQKFFARAPESFLRAVRKLVVLSPLAEGGGGFAEWEVDLRQERAGARFVDMGTLMWNSVEEKWLGSPESLAKEMEMRLGGVVEGILRRGGTLEREDAGRLLQAISG